MKCKRAIKKLRDDGKKLESIIVAGGVAANSMLRSDLKEFAAAMGLKLILPRFSLCTDNGAMIAFAGAMRLMAGEQVEASDGRFAVRPRWSLQEITPPQAAA